MMFTQKKLIRLHQVVQTFDGIETYPYGTNAFKVCESEMLNGKRFIL